jgi:hypothetical protein
VLEKVRQQQQQAVGTVRRNSTNEEAGLEPEPANHAAGRKCSTEGKNRKRNALFVIPAFGM